MGELARYANVSAAWSEALMQKLLTVAIIPARGGSKGLPRKNVALLGGKPLIAWTIEAAKRSGAVDRIFVTTDSEQIAEASINAGAEVPFLRPSDLAADQTSMEDTLRYAILAFEEWSGKQFDIGVFLTPTDVFRRPQWIADAVRLLKERNELESVFAGRATFKNYWEALPLGGFQRLRPYMQIYGQRQERIANKRIVYREDTGVACASRTRLWREGRRIGNVVDIISSDELLPDVDIHSEFDMFMAEQALSWFERHGIDLWKGK